MRHWLAIVPMLLLVGCHHDEAKVEDTNKGMTVGQLKVSPQNDPRLDSVIQEMVSNTGVQVYPGALVDRTQPPTNRLAGTQHFYTAAFQAKDTLKTVANFYERELGVSYVGSVSSGRLDGEAPNGSTVRITFQQRSNATLFTIDSSTPRPTAGMTQPVSQQTQVTASQPAQQTQQAEQVPPQSFRVGGPDETPQPAPETGG